MSTPTDIVTQVRLATDYQNNKKLLNEKIKNELHVTHAGGMFLATPELISFLSVWPDEEVYLEDVFHNPIRVVRTNLLNTCISHYRAVMNGWHIQHEEIKRIRKI
jgi:hypothetical protein